MRSACHSTPPIQNAVGSSCCGATSIVSSAKWPRRRPEDKYVFLSNEFEGILGASQALRVLLEQVRTVASTDSTVLIEGETGTGKELIARALHNCGPRRAHHLVALNCAAIPGSLLESELFGYERGAFTGALTRKIGRFELADKGTLFLDEIGDLPLELQAKLLRVLQDGEFERLGGCNPIHADFRLVAATHQNLQKMVANRRFRADFYYRLNVFPIQVPSLRERADDIPILVKSFVATYSRQMNKRIEIIPEDTLDALKNYHWPGNIRELQNFIERSVILSRDTILQAPLQDLRRLSGFESRASGIEQPPTSVTLCDAQRDHILRVLEETQWRIGGPNGAAKKLGLKRSTLYFKMRKLGVKCKPQAISVPAQSPSAQDDL